MGFFKLGGMTLGGIFKKPETLKYPFESKEPYEGQKGVIKNSNYKDCTLCGICSKKCPTKAIEVDRDKRTWSIMHYQCIQCGYCTQNCPKKCLVMDGHKPDVVSKKKAEVVKIPAAKKPAAKKEAETKPDEKTTPKKEK